MSRLRERNSRQPERNCRSRASGTTRLSNFEATRVLSREIIARAVVHRRDGEPGPEKPSLSPYADGSGVGLVSFKLF